MNHAEIEAAFASAVMDPKTPTPPWALSPRGDVDARRFSVYRNNVHVGLVGVLRAKFPVTARIVGEEFFTAMARAFCALDKPRSPLLAEYGDTFPDFIEAFAPAAGLPYLADVARLECHWLRAYHAADAAALALTDISTLPPSGMLALTLAAHPAAALVASRHPVGSIWSANRSAGDVRLRASGAETILVTRPGYEVDVRIVSEADGRFCASLFGGETIEAAAEAAAARFATFDLGTALVGLVSAGAFVSNPHPGTR
jgi:hypothetical protein